MDITTNQYKKFNRKPVDTGMIYGKVPPQAKQLEESVLGAIMLEKTAFDIANDILQPDCFYGEGHQRIFKAMQSLASKSYPIDMMTIVEELKLSESLEIVGGPYAISKLTHDVVSGASVEVHSRIVLQKFLMRELIRVSSEVINQAYDDSSDVFDVLDFAEENVSGLRMNNVRKNFKELRKVVTENLKSLEELRLRDEAITGVPSGFDDLDKVTCGWQPTDLIILAARPSVGKTAFALTLAKNAAKSFNEEWLKDKQAGINKQKKSVGFFSLEMSDRQLVNRVLSSESLVWMWRLQNGKLNDWQMSEIYKGAEKLNSCEILIDDTAALKIQEFKTKARIMKRKHNVGIIVIDYLQLMKDPTKKMREQEISSISSQLKEMAKELEIPIIALSQLNREFGKAGSLVREPQLSDIRESGAIEQDADLVMFLFKPSREEIEQDKELEHIFYNKIEKFRNGTAPVKFIGKFLKETQMHEWLKVVDSSSMAPIGPSWTPVQNDSLTSIINKQPPVNNHFDPKEADELPF